MSSTARLLGLMIAVAMMLFSGWIFLKTGDWVAVVFCLGSVAYIVFFVSGLKEQRGRS